MAVPIGVPHLERAVGGFLEYAAGHGRWRLATSPESPILSLAGLRGWPGDGILAFINTPADARTVAQLGLPAVNISGALERSPVPRVRVDDRAVGRLAAEHLLDRGFRQTAYYGVEGVWYARLRGEGFLEVVEQAGARCDVFLAPSTLGRRAAWSQVDRPLRAWLKSLPLPAGLFACSDYRAKLILEGCQELGLAVPDDLAVVGVNNDTIACEFCEPPLSSVSRSSERVGREAAALLERLMAGKPAPEADVLIPPDGLICRRSTDAFALGNPDVAAAVRYMHEHLAEAISIGQFAHEQAVSRRKLEHAFREILGQPPHAYLTGLRVRRARQVLVEQPSLPLQAVAKACGFCDAKRLRAAFLAAFGVSPREYRERAAACQGGQARAGDREKAGRGVAEETRTSPRIQDTRECV